jgi:DNA topoisomerase-1
MSKNLVIVESPAKAKTIEGYLGKDFKVESSYGHVRDLPSGDKAIDIENGFAPTYEVTKDKKEVVKNLKSLAKKSDMVYLASDDDREGEAISWHLMQALDLNDSNYKRIVFREITQNAITNAMKSPRGIDIDLVNAQQARRVLDRLVGYEISPILWRKIKTGLSAGRVQSVAVRVVVDREREIEKFESKYSYKITAEFNVDSETILKAELPKRFPSREEAEEFLKSCISADFQIADLQKKPAKKSPAPPFTTSTLQQEASRKLGYSVSKTMTLAQKLYESGKISYMRTDSLNLSEEAIQNAKSQIIKAYGKEYSNERKFKTKTSGAQEAHEAIRPTDFSISEAGNDAGTQRLYELIWKRAIASQMAEAQLEKTTVTISISSASENLVAKGEVVKFDGFLKVYTESFDEDNSTEKDSSGILPPLNIGQKLKLKEMTGRQGFSKHPPRYTEASLVKKLEELGIGRPSTYAPTISTVQKRNYVSKESRPGTEREYTVLTLANDAVSDKIQQEITGAEKNKLFPTDMGMIVNDFLTEHFSNVVDYSFTANVEKEFDEIANGQKEWNGFINDFYGGFHAVVEEIQELKTNFRKIREIGIDPASGKKVYARMGKFGPMAQIGEIPEEGSEEKPQYASLRTDQLIDTLTLEEALDLFKLPRTVGNYEDEEMVVGIGRFGPYIRHNGKFVSLEETDDPYTIEEDRALELVKAKREADAKMLIKSFEENPDIRVLNGRYGPYIKAGKKNVKIPKDKVPETLTLAECLELAEKTPEKRFKKKKK